MLHDRREIQRLLDRIRAQRTVFGAASTSLKLRLLMAGRKIAIRTAEQLIAYHDLLLFACAYPDSPRILGLARRELREFRHRLAYLRSTSRANKFEPLVNSGLVDTEVSHLFSFDLTKMLCEWYPGKLELDWAESDEEESAGIFTFLPLLVSFHENDTLDNASILTTQAWLHRARGRKLPSDLAALLRMLDRSNLSLDLQRHFYDNAGVIVRWKVGRSQASRTHARVPSGRIFFQTEPILSRTDDLRREILSRPPKLELLHPNEGAHYVRVINEALAVRYRELYPVTGANAAEVYRAEPGRGIQIFFFGAKPEFRLPLEANFGAMLVRNGVPVGYGVGACLLERVEIAINVFPAFRTGESSFIIEQFFKLFHHNFGSSVLLVRSRQVGDGDDEPIQSGAFWFYYKLGFRPVKPEIRRLADREAAYIAAHPGYRSSISKLKRLSKSDVFLDLKNPAAQSYDELSIVNLGYAVTDLIAREFAGDRRVATAESVKRVTGWLGIKSASGWSTSEKTALERMAPLLAAAPEIKAWSRDQKTTLALLIRAKGGRQERKFVIGSISHPGFPELLHRIASRSAR